MYCIVPYFIVLYCTVLIDITECGSDTCSGNGECIEKIGGGTSCCCDEGFSGSDCSVSIDYCAQSPCENSGTCVNDKAGYNCDCTSPWTGKTCGTG